MTSLLLTATNGVDPGQLAALTVLTVLGWRLALIALFPFAPCRHCKGTSKHLHGKHFRPCRWCHGTGRRTRLTRRIWNWTRTHHHTR